VSLSRALGLLGLAIVAPGCRSERASVAAASSVAATAPSSAATATTSPSASASTVPAAPASTAPKLRVEARREGPWGVGYAPADLPAAAAPVVYFHGMWSNPEESCPYFELGVAGTGVLLCPRGNMPVAQGGAYGGPMAKKRASLDDALAIARTLTDGGALADEGVLLGFSSGASMALEVAYAEPGRWPGLVLMSMSVSLSPAALRKAGVRRVVLASAENDGSCASLRATAKSLESAGYPARFVSFGLVGHHYAVDMRERMRDAIAWVRAR
jgi:predicted esterase